MNDHSPPATHWQQPTVNIWVVGFLLAGIVMALIGVKPYLDRAGAEPLPCGGLYQPCCDEPAPWLDDKRGDLPGLFPDDELGSQDRDAEASFATTQTRCQPDR